MHRSAGDMGENLLRRESLVLRSPAVAAVMVWGFGSFDMCHLAAEHNDYTFRHLPSCDRIPLPNKLEANPASFAARMAFSSLLRRSMDK